MILQWWLAAKGEEVKAAGLELNADTSFRPTNVMMRNRRRPEKEAAAY